MTPNSEIEVSHMSRFDGPFPHPILGLYNLAILFRFAVWIEYSPVELETFIKAYVRIEPSAARKSIPELCSISERLHSNIAIDSSVEDDIAHVSSERGVIKTSASTSIPGT